MHVVIVVSREGENPKTPNAHEFMKLLLGRGKPEDPSADHGWEGENPKTPVIGCAISQVT